MALWTDLAKWVGPTKNRTVGGMSEYRGVVLHTASGYYQGTIAWQLDSSNDVSSHFIVAGPRDLKYGGVDGAIAQMVDTADAAWTQRAGNGHWLSIECSGFGGTNSGTSGDRLSPAQIESCAKILARAHREHNVPLQLATNPDGRGLGHHSMGCNWPGGAWGHCYCPGDPIIAQKPLILARATEIVIGDDMSEQAEREIHDLWYATFASDPANRPAGSQSRDAKTMLAIMTKLAADVTAALGRDPLDEQTVIDGVLAGLLPTLSAEQIADQVLAHLTPELAVAVVAAMGAKLATPPAA